MVAIVILAKDIPTIKQSHPIGCARLIIMPPTNNSDTTILKWFKIWD
jgi:hypothetical protein